MTSFCSEYKHEMKKTRYTWNRNALNVPDSDVSIIIRWQESYTYVDGFTVPGYRTLSYTIQRRSNYATTMSRKSQSVVRTELGMLYIEKYTSNAGDR